MNEYDVILIKTPTTYTPQQHESLAGSFFRLNTSMGSLGLVMLATVLERNGYSAHVFYPENIQDIVVLVNKYRPKIVGISSETVNVSDAYRIPAILNHAGCNVFKVIGGYHATFEYQDSLKAGYDCVVIGEGESTFLEIVKAVTQHQTIGEIHGIAYIDDKGGVSKSTSRSFIEDLDLLPFPNWALSDQHLPSYLGIIYATRGCSLRCNFCVSSEYYGHMPRYRSAESIIEEIEQKKYRIVYFQDDDFTSDLERIKRLHDYFTQSKHIPIMVIYSRMDTIAKHPEVATMLARMGVRLVYFGIESHNQEGLNYVHKGLRIDDQEKAIRVSHEANLNVWASIMILPNETKLSWEETIRFVKKKVRPSISTVGICVPFPGTALYKKLISEGRILHQDWRYYDGLHCVFEPDHLDPVEVEQLMFFGDKTLNANPLLKYGAGWLATVPAGMRYTIITIALTGRIPRLF